MHGQVSAVVELVEGDLSEVRGLHDGEAIFGDVAVDFRVCKEEGAVFGLGVVEAFED